MVERWADATPDAPAVAGEHGRLSYAELDALANRLAWAMRDRGVGPDRLVAVCLPRGIALVPVLLAILKAGGAYLALDAGQPPARLRQLCADASPVLAVTTDGLAGELVDLGQVWTVADLTGLAAWAADRTDRPPSTTGPDDLAYVTYTSGSTGAPKGVMVTHRGIANLADARQPMAPRRGELVGVHSPLAFDASTYELWAGLNAGACLWLAGGADPLSVADYRRLAAAADVLCLTPSLFNLLVDEGCTELGTVRLLNVGGEAVDAAHMDRMPAGPTVFNCYGPTECTMLSTVGPATRRTPSGRIPIGGPLRGVRTYVLDDELAPAPVGVTGELYLASEGLARGYLGQPGRTAERFVPDPFDGSRGERLYRTGDLARWLPGGELEFLGRVDSQVKLRGFRIEPGEVEAALRLDERVRDAVVVPRESSRGVRQLVGYLVLAAGEPHRSTPELLDQIRARLASRLPDYLVPAVLVDLPAVPLTGNGKVDRSSLARRPLPAPRAPGTDPDRPEQPATGTQRLVTEVWSAAFEVGQIGPDDDFFGLGGDSLRALRIVAELEGQGHQLTVPDLYELGTVRRLAAYLDGRPA